MGLRLRLALTILIPLVAILGIFAYLKVDLFEANLREPEVTQLTWSDERLAAIKEQLRLSVRSMKAYLVDPAANVAAIDDFEKAEDLRICKWCNFRTVCRPELTQV